MNIKLSIVLSTKNEEANIGDCLESVKNIADEIIVFDEYSEDKTRDIAEKYGAKVFKYKHKTNFHETKQKAIEKAKGEWILQLDADELVTPELAKEIVEVINSENGGLTNRVLTPSTIHDTPNTKKATLFYRHQQLIEKREGRLGKPIGEDMPAGRQIVAFFIPRKNMFLGKPLIHGGVYPDGVIRLIKQGYARLPGKSVHELMEVDGEIGWLFNDLEHHDSPTFARYFDRLNRYTDLIAIDFGKDKLPISYWNLFNFSFLVPSAQFSVLYFRHKGILDGMQGFIWSLFSSLRFPIAYYKYYSLNKNNRHTTKLPLPRR